VADGEWAILDAQKHVVVVERDAAVRQTICELLVDLGCRVDMAENAAEMRRSLARSDPVDLIVLDASVSEAETVTLAVQAREHGVRLVMISGRPATMEQFEARADQLLWKPFHRADLERAVRYAFASEVRGQRVQDPSAEDPS
jgi:DNA-binding response OmpR family regulator